jgi:hypothetical protein
MVCSPLNEIRRQEDIAMAKAQRYSLEQVRAAQKKLRGLAVKNAGKTRAEVVEFLAGDIRKAMEKGHSPAEIRDILAREGIQSALSRLAALWKKRGRDSAKKGRGLCAGSARNGGLRAIHTVRENRKEVSAITSRSSARRVCTWISAVI